MYLLKPAVLFPPSTLSCCQTAPNCSVWKQMALNLTQTALSFILYMCPKLHTVIPESKWSIHLACCCNGSFKCDNLDKGWGQRTNHFFSIPSTPTGHSCPVDQSWMWPFWTMFGNPPGVQYHDRFWKHLSTQLFKLHQAAWSRSNQNGVGVCDMGRHRKPKENTQLGLDVPATWSTAGVEALAINYVGF